MSTYHEDLSAWAATQAALIRQGRLAETTFPPAFPFRADQVLDPAFLPE